jgi:tetrapyrrole methylase family protein/MazG family protein
METNSESAAQAVAQAFQNLYEAVKRLRAPDGCPWDLEQTPQTLRGDLIEETFECVEAIDEGDPAHIREELGDIFLLAVMIAYMHEQEGLFSLPQVLETIREKVIRRHPHVFGDLQVKDSAEVLEHWRRIKVEEEGRTPQDSLLDGVSRGLPPLDRAYKIQKKAAEAGFDWPEVSGVMDKVREELDEVSDVLEKGGDRDALEAELGDVLFSAVNLCRFLQVEPSVALQRTIVKFTGRFKRMEQQMKELGLVMNKKNFAVMDIVWDVVKGDLSPTVMNLWEEAKQKYRDLSK